MKFGTFGRFSGVIQVFFGVLRRFFCLFSAFSTKFNFSMKILGRFFVRKFKKATVLTFHHIACTIIDSNIGNFRPRELLCNHDV